MTRPITLVYVGSGWGARDMRTAKGASQVAKYLKEYLPAEAIEEFYADYHIPDCHSNVDSIPSNEHQQRFSQVTRVVTDLCYIVKDILTSGRFPIIIGGDHSIAIGTWSGVKLAQPERDFGLLWFDAHMDAHTPQTSESQAPHGMPLAALMGYGLPEWVKLGNATPKLHPKNIAQIGIRSYEAGEKALLEKSQVQIHYMEDVLRQGLSSTYATAFKHVTKTTPFFGLSIDIDAFDPSVAPGTGTTEPNGIMLEDMLPLVSDLRSNPHCLGLEIVEFNPDKDVDNKTLKLLMQLIKAAVNL